MQHWGLVRLRVALKSSPGGSGGPLHMSLNFSIFLAQLNPRPEGGVEGMCSFLLHSFHCLWFRTVSRGPELRRYPEAVWCRRSLGSAMEPLYLGYLLCILATGGDLEELNVYIKSLTCSDAQAVLFLSGVSVFLVRSGKPLLQEFQAATRRLQSISGQWSCNIPELQHPVRQTGPVESGLHSANVSRLQVGIQMTLLCQIHILGSKPDYCPHVHFWKSFTGAPHATLA